jgi:hypothetical protein
LGKAAKLHYSPDLNPPLVTLVTFGSVNVGDPEWAGNFAQKVNARQLALASDLIPNVSSAIGYTAGLSCAHCAATYGSAGWFMDRQPDLCGAICHVHSGVFLQQ